MRRWRAIVNLIAIVLIVLATIRLWQRRHPTPPVAIDAPSILDRRVAPLEFRNLALDDAVERLSRAAGVELVIDTADPVMGTVVSTENFSLTTWEGMTLNSALAALVKPNQSDMRFFVDRGRVWITTSPPGPVTTRIYDVHDLWLAAIDDVPPDFDRPKVWGGFSGPIQVATTLPPGTVNRKQAIEAQALWRLGNLIMYSLPGSDAYVQNGGRGADLHAVEGRLIATQTAEGHRRITRLLELVRQVRANPVDGRRD